jgi:AcrR family transcriptional regulator
MARKYELKKRAERMEETKRRIVEAAIDLHTSVGPAQTTVSAIADRASVERQTCYRHFPDERSLFSACSGLYMERNPLPDPGAWHGIAVPEERLRRGLGELYRYYDANEPMLSNILRDAEVHAITREAAALQMQLMASYRDVLAEGLSSGKPRTRLNAALDLAVSFHTWRSLVRESGLSVSAAVELMAATVLRAGDR